MSDIKSLMAGKRFEPGTGSQWDQAEAGAAACDRDWNAGEMPAFLNGGLAGADRYYRAAYELRYHEIIAENADWLNGREHRFVLDCDMDPNTAQGSRSERRQRSERLPGDAPVG